MKKILFVASILLMSVLGISEFAHAGGFDSSQVFNGIDRAQKNSNIGNGSALSDSDPLKRLLNNAFIWAGIIAVIMIMVAGINYVLAAGDAGKLGKAKTMLIYTIIGLLVVVLSGAIVNFVVGGIF